MSLMHLAFGRIDPSPRRLVVGSLAYLVLALAMHGMATQFLTGSFLVAPFLCDPPAWAAFCALSAIPSGLMYWWLPPGPNVERHSPRHAVLCLLAVPLFAFVAWLAFAGSVSAIYTRLAGQPHSEVVDLRTEHRFSRRGCDYRAESVRIDGRVRETLCIPSALYDAHPDQVVRTQVVGRRSSLGFAIDSFRFHDDPAGK
jgi:hypothetical protein